MFRQLIVEGDYKKIFKDYPNLLLESRWRKILEAELYEDTDTIFNMYSKLNAMLLSNIPKDSRKKTILIVSANPEGTVPLKLDTEILSIKEAVQDKYNVEFVRNTSTEDLIILLEKLKPSIVHFIGHGKEQSLVLSSAINEKESLTLDTLSKLVVLYKLDLIVLNVCNSATLANQLSIGTTCIGSAIEVSDATAIKFSSTFYKLLKNEEFTRALKLTQVSLDANNYINNYKIF